VKKSADAIEQRSGERKTALKHLQRIKSAKAEPHIRVRAAAVG
jgi:hypothetical protein